MSEKPFLQETFPHQLGSSSKCSCIKSMEKEGVRTSSICQAVPGCLYLHVCDEVMESHSSALFLKQFSAHNCNMNQGKLFSLFWLHLTEPHSPPVISPILEELIKTSFTKETQPWNKITTIREQRCNSFLDFSHGHKHYCWGIWKRDHTFFSMTSNY